MDHTCSRKRSPSTRRMSGSFRSTSFGTGRRQVAGGRGQLPLAPLQLLAQELEVAARRCLDESKHLRRFLHANDIALVDGVTVLAVVGHEDIFGSARRLGMHLYFRISGDDHRS